MLRTSIRWVGDFYYLPRRRHHHHKTHLCHSRKTTLTKTCCRSVSCCPCSSRSCWRRQTSCPALPHFDPTETNAPTVYSMIDFPLLFRPRLVVGRRTPTCFQRQPPRTTTTPSAAFDTGSTTLLWSDAFLIQARIGIVMKRIGHNVLDQHCQATSGCTVGQMMGDAAEWGRGASGYSLV